MIELKNITFSYKKSESLLQDLSLHLEAGKIYGLLGKNGAGKTTLLKILTGLLNPQCGISTTFGIPAIERKPEVLQKIFYIPEEFELPSISSDKFIEINAPFYSAFSKEQFDAYIKEFEIGSFNNLKKVSFGQKKKFLIAFAIATNAQVLIFDEPTNGLDIPSKSQFRKIMASSIDEQRMVIISTHQVRDLSQLIDHIIVLENGNIIFSETTFDITSKLSFGHLKSANDAEVYYSEPSLGGHSAIFKNEGQETELDIELFFNAIISNHPAINQAINS